MQRQRGELVPIGEVVADLAGPVKAIRSGPLTARIDPGSSRARGKGVQEEALTQASLPTMAKIRIGFSSSWGQRAGAPGMRTEFERLALDADKLPPSPNAVRRPDWRSSSAKRLMPQLQIKAPTLRRWGTKLAVAVDMPFLSI